MAQSAAPIGLPLMNNDQAPVMCPTAILRPSSELNDQIPRVPILGMSYPSAVNEQEMRLLQQQMQGNQGRKYTMITASYTMRTNESLTQRIKSQMLSSEMNDKLPSQGSVTSLSGFLNEQLWTLQQLAMAARMAKYRAIAVRKTMLATVSSRTNTNQAITEATKPTMAVPTAASPMSGIPAFATAKLEESSLPQLTKDIMALEESTSAEDALTLIFESRLGAVNRLDSENDLEAVAAFRAMRAFLELGPAKNDDLLPQAIQKNPPKATLSEDEWFKWRSTQSLKLP